MAYIYVSLSVAVMIALHIGVKHVWEKDDNDDEYSH